MKILLVPCILYLFATIKAETQYFKSVSGTVIAGNFTYYSLITEGDVSIILRTTKGDADLYVSQLVVTPTYEPENYCLHSATCGLDVVDIPATFGRPIGIGIYGHPSHEESEFTLELEGAIEDKVDSDGSENLDESGIDSEPTEENATDESHFLLTFILTFLDILLEVFLL
uniref:Putative dna repair endonuclease xpf isoform x1 n=1 Tax=Panstrongylus lignarius TaxID=156445 RepID=A0A224XUU6_9HEMI